MVTPQRALCVFDLDHTLVRSPLDLRAVRAEVAALAAEAGLAPGPEGTTVGALLTALEARAPALARRAWALVTAHEDRAVAQAEPEPGAREALEALARAGCPLAVWTNNARATAQRALDRCALRGFFVALVSRDEAPLKPDPAGLRLLEAAHPGRAVWVVGDSWIDGAAAQAGGAGFIGYRTDPAELRRRGVVAQVVLQDLRALPTWLLGACGRPTL